MNIFNKFFVLLLMLAAPYLFCPKPYVPPKRTASHDSSPRGSEASRLTMGKRKPGKPGSEAEGLSARSESSVSIAFSPVATPHDGKAKLPVSVDTPKDHPDSAVALRDVPPVTSRVDTDPGTPPPVVVSPSGVVTHGGTDVKKDEKLTPNPGVVTTDAPSPDKKAKTEKSWRWFGWFRKKIEEKPAAKVHDAAHDDARSVSSTDSTAGSEGSTPRRSDDQVKEDWKKRATRHITLSNAAQATAAAAGIAGLVVGAEALAQQQEDQTAIDELQMLTGRNIEMTPGQSEHSIIQRLNRLDGGGTGAATGHILDPNDPSYAATLPTLVGTGKDGGLAPK